MTINDIEQAIIKRLQEKITTLKVEGFPEKPDEYVLTHPKGVVLVQFFSSDFSDSLTDEDILQQETLQFIMSVSVRGLRTHTGAYEYIEQIRQALTGYVLSSCRPIKPKQIKFAGEEAGIWTYVFIFELKRKAIPDYE
ncbi:MAG: Gp37 protein [bacterium ADurb.Bin363]|nr:MAG: Gp37 protein [bacterium ADurb.Bin363]